MNIILSPAVALMSRLKYGGKFLLVSILLITVTLVMTYQLSTSALSSIEYSHQEIYAIDYLKKIISLYKNSLAFRQLELSYLSGDGTAKDKLNTLQNTINDQVSDIDAYDKIENVHLSSTEMWKKVKVKWDKIKTTELQTSLQEQFILQREFVDTLFSLIMQVATTSGLILDPDFDSYILMDLTTIQLPYTINQISIMRDIILYNLAKISPANQSRYVISNSTLGEVYLPNTISELKRMLNYNTSLQPHYASFDDLVTDINDFISMANQLANPNNQNTITIDKFYKKADQTIEYAFQFYNLMLDDLENLINVRISNAQKSLYFNIVLCLLGTLLVVYFLSAIYFSIENAIAHITDGTNSMTQGELDKKILLDTNDEMNRIASSFNAMQNTIASFINETQEVMASAVLGDLTQKISVENKQGYSKKLAEILNKLIRVCQNLIKEVKISTNTVNSAAKEIASGNVDLSARTESQAASLQETSASLEELTSTVKQNAENAKEANTLSAKASEIASKGGGVVKEVVTMMGDINDSSRRIVDIISVIDGIAFQTNILALNAAVEAARAGEQGRGFAVVATEVRSLAQRSATAAKEIKALIEDSVNKIENGSKLADQAGSTMEEIVASIKKVANIMGEITAASLQQSIGIEQVNQAVSQMDSITQKNAALVNKAANTAQVLEAQTQHMTDIISTFKVDDNENGELKHTLKADVITPNSMENLSMIYDTEEKQKRAKSEPNIHPKENDTWEEF